MVEIFVNSENLKRVKEVGKCKRGNFLSGEKNQWLVPDEMASSLKVSSGEQSKNAKSWESVLKKYDTIYVAKALKDYGMPVLLSQKVEMLRILGNRRFKKNLTIHYDDLCDYCSEFEKAYPPERIQSLVEKIAGTSDFYLGVKNGSFTDEERALLEYVFGTEE